MPEKCRLYISRRLAIYKIIEVKISIESAINSLSATHIVRWQRKQSAKKNKYQIKSNVIKSDFQNENTSDMRHCLNEVLNFHEEIKAKGIGIGIDVSIDKNPWTVEANICGNGCVCAERWGCKVSSNNRQIILSITPRCCAIWWYSRARDRAETTSWTIPLIN